MSHPTWVSRDVVIEDCELGEVGDPRARLRQICWIIRSRVGGELLVGDRRRLGISPDVHSDFLSMQRWCHWIMDKDFSRSAIEAVPDWFIRALNLPLLSDWQWDDSWLQPAQTHWDVLRMEVLSRLSEVLLELGRPEQALLCAHGLIQQDPLREAAWEFLISALVNSGRRAEARVQFDRLTTLLRSELGVPPSQSTRGLVAELYRQ